MLEFVKTVVVEHKDDVLTFSVAKTGEIEVIATRGDGGVVTGPFVIDPEVLVSVLGTVMDQMEREGSENQLDLFEQD